MATDPVGYAQSTFEATYSEAILARKPLFQESMIRRGLAYALKAVAIFGGLAVASGLFTARAQYIGIAIAVAVALDSLFSNHIRMMLTTKAADAYDRLAKQARRSHQVDLTAILQIKTKEPEKAQDQLLGLLTKLTTQLQSGCTEIESALSEGHIKALDGLSLDSDRSRPATPPPGG